MKDSELRVGDKVVCILDQRFRGVVKSIHEKTGFAYQYEVDFETEVPYDASGAVFFYWQLKKIEEEKKECWIDVMPVIVWRVVPSIGGYYLKGHYKNELICYFKLNEIDLYDHLKNDYKLEKSKDGRYFKILKKDC